MMKNAIIVFTFVSIIYLLFSCGGANNKNSGEQSSVSAAEAMAASKIISGEEIYRKTCIACHQANGEGIVSTFPPLAKSDFLSNRQDVIRQVIEGKTGEMTVNGVKYNSIMPPQNLNDEEIAAVLTYVYSSWGNSGDAVTVDEVKAVREKKS